MFFATKINTDGISKTKGTNYLLELEKKNITNNETVFQQ